MNLFRLLRVGFAEEDEGTRQVANRLRRDIANGEADIGAATLRSQNDNVVGLGHTGNSLGHVILKNSFDGGRGARHQAIENIGQFGLKAFYLLLRDVAIAHP